MVLFIIFHLAAQGLTCDHLKMCNSLGIPSLDNMKLDAMLLICVQLFIYLCPDMKVTLAPKKKCLKNTQL